MAEARNELSPELESKFRQGIDLILSQWRPLQMTLAFEWHKRGSGLRAQIEQSLSSDLFSWFTNSEPKTLNDVMDRLLKAMDSLQVMPDDDGLKEVAEKLMVLHQNCLDGKIEKEIKSSGYDYGWMNSGGFILGFLVVWGICHCCSKIKTHASS